MAWNNVYIPQVLYKKAHCEIAPSLMVSENWLDLLKWALRKSYPNQKILFKYLQASLLYLCCILNSLYYSWTLLLSQKLHHAIYFNGPAQATYSVTSSHFKWNRPGVCSLAWGNARFIASCWSTAQFYPGLFFLTPSVQIFNVIFLSQIWKVILSFSNYF